MRKLFINRWSVFSALNVFTKIITVHRFSKHTPHLPLVGWTDSPAPNSWHWSSYWSALLNDAASIGRICCDILWRTCYCLFLFPKSTSSSDSGETCIDFSGIFNSMLMKTRLWGMQVQSMRCVAGCWSK